MPLWNIAHPADAFSPELKKALADAITQLYVEFGLPRFYVNVFYWETSKETCFIGGEPTDDYIRIWIDHVALDTVPSVRYSREMIQAWVRDGIGAAVKPFIEDRGYRWELHIDDTPFELWTVNGMFPPRPFSAISNIWARDNKPSEFDYDSPDNVPAHQVAAE